MKVFVIQETATGTDRIEAAVEAETEEEALDRYYKELNIEDDKITRDDFDDASYIATEIPFYGGVK